MFNAMRDFIYFYTEIMDDSPEDESYRPNKRGKPYTVVIVSWPGQITLLNYSHVISLHKNSILLFYYFTHVGNDDLCISICDDLS